MDMNILYNACIMLIRTELISEIFLINLYYYSFLRFEFRFNKLMINFFLNLKLKILEKEIKSRNRQITYKLSL